MALDTSRLVWPALILSPLLVLLDQVIVYALTTPSCGAQTAAWLHAVAALSLLLSLVLNAGTVVAWRRQRGDAGDAAQRRRFFVHAALGTGAMATVFIIGLWLPSWWLSPCAA